MKYISIAFVILVAGANFTSSQTPPPKPPVPNYNKYDNLGPCYFYSAGSTQWMRTWLDPNPGGGEPMLFFYVTPGDNPEGYNRPFPNRAEMEKYCNQPATKPCGFSGSASTTFWPTGD